VTTIELLAILQEQFKGWNADGERGILPHLNAAHFILAANKSEQNVYCDEANGELPALATTALTYNYSLDSNLWMLDSILVKVEEISQISGTLVSLTGFDYGSRRYTAKPMEYITWGGLEFVRIPFLRSWPATETAAARCMFTANPGDSTDYYRQYGYKKPTQIISDAIDPDIPPPWDYQYLLPATAKLIEGIQHGNYVEARQYVVNVLKPELKKEMNCGEQGFDYEADDRGF
jgi:hypothetical protein